MKLKDNRHGYYLVKYEREQDWSPAEGGTIYHSGDRYVKKWGPFATVEAAKGALNDKLHIFEEDSDDGDYYEVHRFGNGLAASVTDIGDNIVYYYVERDDQWGSKQTAGGGWDWPPEKAPIKHARRGKWVLVDINTGEVIAEEKDQARTRPMFGKPGREYIVKKFKEDPAGEIAELEIRFISPDGKIVEKWPYKGMGVYDSEQVPSTYNKETKDGYKIVQALQNKDGRKFIIVKRPNDFAFGAGYDIDDGTWAAGYYGFETEADAKQGIYHNYPDDQFKTIKL